MRTADKGLVKVLAVLVGYAFHIACYLVVTTESSPMIYFRGDYGFYMIGVKLFASHLSPYVGYTGLRYLPLGVTVLYLSDTFLGFWGWIVVTEAGLLVGTYFLITGPKDTRSLMRRVEENWVGLCLLFATAPLLDSSQWKTADVLAFMFIAMAWHFSSKGRLPWDQVLSGTFLGFAIGLKTVPAILLGLFIYRRQIISVASAIAVNALGLGFYSAYLPSEPITALKEWLAVTNFNNYQFFRSDSSNPVRLLYHALFQNEFDNRWLALFFAALLVAIMALNFTQRKVQDDRWLFYFSLLTMHFISDSVYEHHLLMSFPVYAMPLTDYGLIERIAALSLLSLALTPYRGFDISFQGPTSVFQAPEIGSFYEMGPIAMSVLYFWLLTRCLGFDSKTLQRQAVGARFLLRKKRTKQAFLALALTLITVVGYYAVLLHPVGSARFREWSSAIDQASPAVKNLVNLSNPVQGWEVDIHERYKPGHLHTAELGSELCGQWGMSVGVADVNAWLARMAIYNNFVSVFGLWIYLPGPEWTTTAWYKYGRTMMLLAAFVAVLSLVILFNHYSKHELPPADRLNQGTTEKKESS